MKRKKAKEEEIELEVDYDLKDSEPKKFKLDLLGRKVEAGDFVIYKDKSPETNKDVMNIAWVQDVARGGIVIKNYVYRGSFLYYNRQYIKKPLKNILQDDIDCMKHHVEI